MAGEFGRRRASTRETCCWQVVGDVVISRCFTSLETIYGSQRVGIPESGKGASTKINTEISPSLSQQSPVSVVPTSTRGHLATGIAALLPPIGE